MAIKTMNSMLPLKQFSEIDIKAPTLVRVPIDSETAKQILELNIKNRLVRRRAVEYIKNQIINGEWRSDHPQPIVFSDCGRLIDGQHRIVAIAELGIKASESLIVRVETGASDSVREYMDTGVPRTLEDRVEVTDNLLHNKVAAQLCGFAMTLATGENSQWRIKRPTPDYFKEWFHKHSESALFVAKHHKRERGTGKIQIAYAAMQYYEISNFKAEEFYPALFIVDSCVQQARMLRDYSLRVVTTNKAIENGAAWRNSLYARAVYCMKAHLQDREIKIIKEGKWS